MVGCGASRALLVSFQGGSGSAHGESAARHFLCWRGSANSRGRKDHTCDGSGLIGQRVLQGRWRREGIAQGWGPGDWDSLVKGCINTGKDCLLGAWWHGAWRRHRRRAISKFFSDARDRGGPTWRANTGEKGTSASPHFISLRRGIATTHAMLCNLHHSSTHPSCVCCLLTGDAAGRTARTRRRRRPPQKERCPEFCDER